MSLGATASAPARGVRDRRLGEQLERHVVVDRAVVAHHAAVAVDGVLAEADVGDHHELGVRVLDRAHRELHDALVVVGARALLVLLGGHAEQQHGRARRARAPAPASSTACEIDSRSTPGIASIGVRASVPSWTNSG